MTLPLQLVHSVLDWIISHRFWGTLIVLVTGELIGGLLVTWGVDNFDVAETDLANNWVKATRKRSGYIAFGFGLALFIAVIVFALVRLFGALPAILRFVGTNLLPSLQVPLISIIIIVGGLGLFAFRAYARVRYGLAEIAFALASIIVSVNSLFSSATNVHNPSSWASVVAAAYLLVRGLDNATYDTNQKAVVRLSIMKLKKRRNQGLG